jgi:hypothetical protein
MKSEKRFDRLPILASLLPCLLLSIDMTSPFLSSLPVEKAQKIGLVNAPRLASFANSDIEKHQKNLPLPL